MSTPQLSLLFFFLASLGLLLSAFFLHSLELLLLGMLSIIGCFAALTNPPKAPANPTD